MQVESVVFRVGLGGDSRYYVSLGAVTLVASKASLFRLGLAFYHVARGNWEVGPSGGRVEVDDLGVYSISSISSASSNRRCSGPGSTSRWVTRLVFESRLGDVLLALLERWASLAVVRLEDLI
jgi:hypothetical protein